MSIDKDALKVHAGLAPFKSRLAGLKPDGAKHTTRCPWHNDSNPSFEVYKKDGAWRFSCFPCDRHGDVLEFVKIFDGLTSFPDALRKVADETNFAEAQGHARFEYDSERAAARLDEITDFLAGRGISPEVARAAGLGVVDFPRLGKSVAIPYGSQSESGQPIVKIRAIAPSTPKLKFRHLQEAPSAHLLYALDEARESLWLNSDLWIVESELDCLMMRTHGFSAISVSSATSCLNKDGSFKFEIPPNLADDADRIFLALDQDDAGNKCADAFIRFFPQYKTFRVRWPFEKKAEDRPQVGHKDVGDLYAAEPDSFSVRLTALASEAVNLPPAWRQAFKNITEMEQGQMRFLIDRILPEGVTFIGALSGSGKTWFALSIAKALTTGEPFLGNYQVGEPVNVLYMVPEAGERSFRRRIERMRINERFLCRTMKDGILNLDDPLLLAAVRELKPVVFLDTAVRFSDAKDENSSSENAKGLANDIFSLLRAGAQAVIGLHHSPKDSANQSMTLENALRGTGDLGAMCDAVYGLQVKDAETNRVLVKCVKPRDFEPVRPFEIQGRPYIDESGDFALLADEQNTRMSLSDAIDQNRKATYQELSHLTGIRKADIKQRATAAGWAKPGDEWERTLTLAAA